MRYECGEYKLCPFHSLPHSLPPSLTHSLTVFPSYSAYSSLKLIFESLSFIFYDTSSPQHLKPYPIFIPCFMFGYVCFVVFSPPPPPSLPPLLFLLHLIPGASINPTVCWDNTRGRKGGRGGRGGREERRKGGREEGRKGRRTGVVMLLVLFIISSSLTAIPSLPFPSLHFFPTFLLPFFLPSRSPSFSCSL